MAYLQERGPAGVMSRPVGDHIAVAPQHVKIGERVFRVLEAGKQSPRAATVTQAGVVSDGSILSGHGGGDYALMDAFVTALAENDPNRILSGPRESLETHLMVFAAEKARHENRVVEIMEMERL